MTNKDEQMWVCSCSVHDNKIRLEGALVQLQIWEKSPRKSQDWGVYSSPSSVSG